MKILKLTIALYIILILTLISSKIYANEIITANNISQNTIDYVPGTNILIGDLNNDRIIDSSDILLILRHISASQTNYEEWLLKDDSLKAADLTGDGKVDDEDSLKLLRYVSAKNNKEIAKEHEDWLNLKIGQNENIEISQVYLSKAEISLKQGSTEQLVAIIVPTIAKDVKLSWQSQNADIVEVCVVFSFNKLISPKQFPFSI